jgi:hypothetical protein
MGLWAFASSDEYDKEIDDDSDSDDDDQLHLQGRLTRAEALEKDGQEPCVGSKRDRGLSQFVQRSKLSLGHMKDNDYLDSDLLASCFRDFHLWKVNRLYLCRRNWSADFDAALHMQLRKGKARILSHVVFCRRLRRSNHRRFRCSQSSRGF